jgi:protein TonB
VKKYLLLLPLLYIPVILRAQTDTVTGKIDKIPYKHVDAVAKFPQGDFKNYISKSLQYNHKVENSIKGQVVLLVGIGTDGSISHVTVLKSLSPAIDPEVIKVINSSPKWKPAMLNGQKVSMDMVFNIDIGINGAKAPNAVDREIKKMPVSKPPVTLAKVEPHIVKSTISPIIKKTTPQIAKKMSPPVVKKGVPPLAKKTTPPVKKIIPVVAKKVISPIIKKPAPAIAKKVIPPVIKKPVPAIAKKVIPPVIKKPVPAIAKKVIPPVIKKPVPAIAKKVIPPVIKKPVPAKKVIPPVIKKPIPAIAKKVIPPVIKKPVPPIAKKVIPPVIKKPVPPIAKKVIPPVIKKPAPAMAKKVIPPVIKKPAPLVKEKELIIAKKKQPEVVKKHKRIVNRGDIFNASSSNARFPGGLTAFFQYLSENIVYPQASKKANIQGRVNLTFVVEEDGSVSDVEIITAPSEDLGQEAIRVLLASPKWKPGIQNGRPVPVSFQIPINFTLVDKPAN